MIWLMTEDKGKYLRIFLNRFSTIKSFWGNKTLKDEKQIVKVDNRTLKAENRTLKVKVQNQATEINNLQNLRFNRDPYSSPWKEAWPWIFRQLFGWKLWQ